MNTSETHVHRSGVMNVEGCECVHNARVFALTDSIRGAKFPLSTDLDRLDGTLTDGIKALANSEAGSGHDQWLTGVIVQFDLTFSNKAWVEAERYHFLDFVSSQSTMHRITRFDLDSAYNEYVDPRIIEVMKQKVSAFNKRNDSPQLSMFKDTPEEAERIAELNRREYLEILYSNPAGFLLTARMTTNYRQLKTIYAQRKNHRLPEWRTFCKWIETLPNSDLIVGGNKNG